MGGDHSQKLLPWRGLILLSRAQTSGLQNLYSNRNCGWEMMGAPLDCLPLAQLQPAWVIFAKHRWVTLPARRRWVADLPQGKRVFDNFINVKFKNNAIDAKVKSERHIFLRLLPSSRKTMHHS